MIKVLIVDDSATARLALRLALESDPGIRVVAEAAAHDDALEKARSSRPDLITMDVFLRRESGLDVAASIMAQIPCPILVVTGGDISEAGLVYRAIEAGALEVCAKPPSPRHPRYASSRDRLIRLVRLLAAVPVVKRRSRSARPGPERQRGSSRGSSSSPRPPRSAARPEILLIGASTGGPPVLREIVAGLGNSFPLPVVVVQHIAPGFASSLASWLRSVGSLRVALVSSTTRLEPGTLYLPDDGIHVIVESRRAVSISTAPPRNHQRPSIDPLFESAASVYGAEAVGALLTGMGDDGVAGMVTLGQAGAYTIAQEPTSCAVDSMPANAIKKGAVAKILPPHAIAAEVARLLEQPVLPSIQTGPSHH